MEKKLFSSKVAIAPMMGYTDKYFNKILSVIFPDIILYTEMINAGAIYHGKKYYLLNRLAVKNPYIVQLGGSDVKVISEAAVVCQDYGYEQININIGCPSQRVQSGSFGACLMLEESLVAKIINECKTKVTIPITIKCRLGVDDQDYIQTLPKFIKTIIDAGVDGVIIHARKAYLDGLCPKKNRSVPPIDYEYVKIIKQRFPKLPMMINGEINNCHKARDLLECFDGIMIGRQAIKNYQFLHDLLNIEQETKFSYDPEKIMQDLYGLISKMGQDRLLTSNIKRHFHAIIYNLAGAKKFKNLLRFLDNDNVDEFYVKLHTFFTDKI